MISMDKKYKTRAGQEVRLLCVDGPGEYPVVGIVGNWLATWTSEGTRYINSSNVYDLVEVNEPKIVKSLCWRNAENGDLFWRMPNDNPTLSVWQRFPAGDREGKVEE